MAFGPTLNTINIPDCDQNVLLFCHSSSSNKAVGAVGGTLKDIILRKKFVADPKAWDLLSIALSVICADLAGHRNKSPDGWTRTFDLSISVADPHLWTPNAGIIIDLLAYLTTDRWTLEFRPNGFSPAIPPKPVYPQEDCVMLLSGGLDSLVGLIDKVTEGRKPLMVSQTVRGDAKNQCLFASNIGTGFLHLQLNHNAELPNPENPPSQRARSILFLAYGVFVATMLSDYKAGKRISLYVCENGFIAINPPLTGARIGSLSTRTTHPVVLSKMQQLLDEIGINVNIENPYRFKTKGEMMAECQEQNQLFQHASKSTSCGRFKQFGYKHCGRCLPCLVRRAAFLKWGKTDDTRYVRKDLGRDDPDYAGFDDVRSSLMGIEECKELGLAKWLGPTISSPLISDKGDLRDMAQRGLNEIEQLLISLKVK
jgi:7-cyano-7-deazaguanine synthase in queuosine biosynthesis